MMSIRTTPLIPTPALGFVGRKNSGKTTLLEKLIAHLTQQGLRVATVKHHGHPHFDIDIPGRDSYRHRSAGARSAIVMSDTRFAQVQELDHPLALSDALARLAPYDLTLVEGFKQEHIPRIELFRAANPRDVEAASTLIGRLNNPPVGIVTDMPEVRALAEAHHIPIFDFEDIEALGAFVTHTFARPKLSVVVQAGGESKRMGYPKDTALLAGKPLIEHVLERIAPLADELVVTTNDPARLAFLEHSYPQLRLATDRLDVRGAIPGIITALSAVNHSAVSIVACDMVAVPAALIAREALLLRPAISENFDLVLPKTQTGLEPFAGVYRKQTCLPHFETYYEQACQQAHNPSVKRAIQGLSCGFIDCTSAEKVARYEGSFANINTPADLKQRERELTPDPTCVPDTL